MEVSKQTSQPSIPEFYDGKSVLVTGGMGFLGKVLIEKLLRTCPGIENIYMLCRSKKGKNVSERLEEITNSPVFDLLREQNPQVFNKIVLIEGDVAVLELGISKTDQEILKEKVSVVLHSAATINFNEPMRVAVNTNLRSLRELLNLCRQMKDFKSFVHISTAYTNWFDYDVKEEVRPTEHDPRDIISLCERLPDKTLDKLTPGLLGKHRSTYTFTKALAEKFAQLEAKNLPIAIVRPSMVGASIAEPKPGWIDSWAASTLFMYVCSIGAYRAMTHIKGHPFDIIPVDMAINMSIAAAWKTALDKESNPKTQFPIVYHSTSGMVNQTTLKEVFYKCVDYGRNNPANNIMWWPKFRLHRYKITEDIDLFLTHLMPAYVIDFFARLAGKKEGAVKLQTTASKAWKNVGFATIEPYKFRADNHKNILAQMSPNDQKAFVFDPRVINWNTYLNDYNMGIRKYLLQEKPKDQVVLKAKLQRFKYASYFVTASTAALSLYILGKTGQLLFGSKGTSIEKTDSLDKSSRNLLSKTNTKTVANY